MISEPENQFQLKKIQDSKINLLQQDDNLYPQGKKIFRISRFILYLLVILLIAFFAFSYQVLFTDNSITQIFGGKIGFFKQLQTLAGDDAKLKGASEDRINILLLGMGGEGHDGPYLTDTMIIASIKPSTGKLAMISIPRDLSVEIQDKGWWKINNANSFGEYKEPGNGGSYTKSVIEQNFNIPIHYYMRVDFSGFEKAIDQIGGIKVNVENSFTDYQFPTDDYKYQVVSFEKGLQTMDGATALNFTRSRHGNNGEGSDFARSKRQQKVIQALKERVLSYSLLMNPKKINDLTKNLSDHVKTDLEMWEVVTLAKLFNKIDTTNILTAVLDDSPDGHLYATVVNGAYMLRPIGENYQTITDLINNVFDQNQSETTKTVSTQLNSIKVTSSNDYQSPKPEAVVPPKAKAEIRNGTLINGLAAKNKKLLELDGIKITKLGNAPTQDYERTQIYQILDPKDQEIENTLQDKYQTTIIKTDVPQWIIDIIDPELNYFIILGQDTNQE